MPSERPATSTTGAAHGVAINEGNGVPIGGTSAGTAHQRLQSAGNSSDPTYADDRDVKIVPFGVTPGGTGGGSVSYALGQWSATARAGTSNIGTALQATPSTGAALQFLLELPGDWDAANQPYINIFYGSGTNTSGTVIWTASSACSKEDTGAFLTIPLLSRKALLLLKPWRRQIGCGQRAADLPR